MKSLMETIRPAVRARMSEDLLRRLHVIDEHDYSGVVRKVREEMARVGARVSNDWLNAGVLALKRYYAIALIDGTNMHAVSDAVDPFWHAHILHTRQYREFCDQIADHYLDHDPLDHANDDDVEFVKRLYQFTRDQYDKCFTFFDERFHPENPAVSELVCIHGNDIMAQALAIFPPIAAAQPTGTSFAH